MPTTDDEFAYYTQRAGEVCRQFNLAVSGWSGFYKRHNRKRNALNLTITCHTISSSVWALLL
jgi:hypothetical protein